MPAGAFFPGLRPPGTCQRFQHRSGLPRLFLRSSLRHHLAVDLSFIPVNRYIELAETAPEFLDVRIAVHAGTNDIRILFLYAPRKAAGTGTVAVARLVRQQAPENVHDEFSVFVQAYALRLSVF